MLHKLKNKPLNLHDFLALARTFGANRYDKA